jgi:hypothetical protein
MASYSSRLDQLVLPIELPCKGKGSKSLLGTFSIATNSYIEPEQFIKYFLPIRTGTLSKGTLAREAFNAESLEEIALAIVKDFKVSTVEVGVSFDVPMDRLSETNFTESVTMYRCGYQCLYSKKKAKNHAWVELPAVITDIIPTISKLTLVLGYVMKVPYLEDIIFGMEKVIVPLNPVLTDEERQAIQEKLLHSKSAYAVITELLDSYQDFPYIVSCALEIKYSHCVLQTDISHTVEVKRR